MATGSGTNLLVLGELEVARTGPSTSSSMAAAATTVEDGVITVGVVMNVGVVAILVVVVDNFTTGRWLVAVEELLNLVSTFVSISP